MGEFPFTPTPVSYTAEPEQVSLINAGDIELIRQRDIAGAGIDAVNTNMQFNTGAESDFLAMP